MCGLHFNLRMRLYKSCVCSVLTYGSEVWRFTVEVMVTLNGVWSEHTDGQCDLRQNTTSGDLVEMEDLQHRQLDQSKTSAVVRSHFETNR